MRLDVLTKLTLCVVLIVSALFVIYHSDTVLPNRREVRDSSNVSATQLVASADCFARLLRNSTLLSSVTESALIAWRSRPDGTEQWATIARTYNSIWKSYFAHLMPMSFVTEDKERKYFVGFKQKDADCNVVTIGVGESVSAERGLFKRYPQCDWLAVDPDAAANERLVKSVPRSRFVPFAVGEKTENRTASIRQKGDKYVNVEIEHVAFADLLATHNGDRVVDLLILDAEGAEFGITPILLDGAAALPVICQMNIEFHGSPERYGYSLEGFRADFSALMREGRYLPLHTTHTRYDFLRMFLVNIKDDVCLAKFIC